MSSKGTPNPLFVVIAVEVTVRRVHSAFAGRSHRCMAILL